MRRALVLCLLAAPAAAQDPAVDTAGVEACFDGSDGPGAACVGAAATLCMERPDGATTAGTTACLQAETAVWDRLLNETYGIRRAEFGAADAADGQGAGRSDALRDAQRAWIAFRDADCALRWTLFREGTIRGIVAAGCLLERTARRTFELRDLGRMEGR